MRAAAELKILGCRRAIQRIRDDVVELEESMLFAPAIYSHECALSTVPFPNLALDRNSVPSSHVSAFSRKNVLGSVGILI
jgi:hypothetical protein